MIQNFCFVCSGIKRGELDERTELMCVVVVWSKLHHLNVQPPWEGALSQEAVCAASSPVDEC